MLSSKPNAASRWVDHVRLWPVLILPHKKAISVDLEKPSGVPIRAFQCILDAHTRRSRFALAGQAWPEKNDANLLQQLAGFREPRWELEHDPLFWLSRVRWQIWKATLSHADLQHGEKLHRGATICPEPTPASNSYTALVAWAYRHRPCNERFNKVCGVLFDGVPIEGRSKFTLPDHQAGHWLLWTGQARGWARLETINRAMALGIHHFRKPDLSPGLVDEKDDVLEA